VTCFFTEFPKRWNGSQKPARRKPTVAETARAETYADVERMICGICWWFVDKFGGEFDDYLSEANVAYMQAHETYDPKRSHFTTWLWWTVRYALLNFVRAERTRMERFALGSDSMEKMEAPPRFDVDRFAGELSADAADVLRLTLDCPHELLACLGLPEVDRGDVCRCLRDAKWSVARVAESFGEIREALMT